MPVAVNENRKSVVIQVFKPEGADRDVPGRAFFCTCANCYNFSLAKRDCTHGVAVQKGVADSFGINLEGKREEGTRTAQAERTSLSSTHILLVKDRTLMYLKGARGHTVRNNQRVQGSKNMNEVE